MAYQTRQRDPLLDSETQAILMRRGQEAVGIGLIALGLALAMMLLSYTPDDPRLWDATDLVPQNMFGRFGATVSTFAIMGTGFGAALLPLSLLVWGLRYVLHLNSEPALWRLIFLPIAVLLASGYASSLTPHDGWPFNEFGLGGIAGDTFLGFLLSLTPLAPATGLKVWAATSALGAILLTGYVLGVTATERRRALRFLIVSLLASFAMIGAAASAMRHRASDAAHQRREARLARQEAATAPMPEAMYDPVHVPVPEAPIVDEPRRAGGILGRMPRLRARDDDAMAEPTPELVVPEPDLPDDPNLSDTDRLRAKIASAVRTRVRTQDTPSPDATTRRRAVPPLTRDKDAPPVSAPIAAAVARVTGADGRVEPTLSAAGIASRLVSKRRAPDPAPSVPRPAALGPMPQPTAPDADQLDSAPVADPEPDFPPAEIADELPAARTPVAPPPMFQRRVVQPTLKRPTTPSRQAMAEAQPSLPLDKREEGYEMPPLTLLAGADTVERHHLSEEALEENARMLENVLDDYGIKGEIVSVRPGPVVTMYELEPAPGLKASRVIGLADDIARSMSALSARVSTVPGRTVIGIELPNQNREKVVLREILSHRDFGDGTHKLPLALGKDIGGDPIVANLAKMPHLLIAGTTGSGKSVAINTMILSLLYKLKPEDCRMIMIDPKMLELSVYDGIPHLLSPVVTDPKKAVVALKWVVGEMEERYRKMSKMGVRNIDGYNGKVADAQSKGEMFSRTVQTGFDDETGDPVFETEEFAPEKMPYIVVIVDEMADLMMVAGKEIEACIQRLAQMARASGIHIIMATQRPSVDVITGTIKANFPTRISFHVTSKVDSRTILGEMGAEQLLGMGDMLYMAGGAKITRVHGPFVSDEEVEEIVSHLKSFGPPDYAASVLDGPDDDRESDIDAVLGLGTGGNTNGEDALYDQAVAIVVKDRKCSTSYIQRKLGIGYNKAARLVEQMEDAGLVSGANHVGKREILVPEQE